MAKVCLVEGDDCKYTAGDNVFIDYSYGEIAGTISFINSEAIILEVAEKIQGNPFALKFGTGNYKTIPIKDILSCVKWTNL